MFRGANNLTLDAKFRLAMPARYRERLQERCGGKLVITVDLDRCLLVYPFPDFEELERKLMKLPSFDKKARRLQRFMVGYANEVDMDEPGRVVVPPSLRDYAGIVRDVMLVGQGLKFELWDEKRWNERRDEDLKEGDSETSLSAELESLSL